MSVSSVVSIRGVLKESYEDSRRESTVGPLKGSPTERLCDEWYDRLLGEDIEVYLDMFCNLSIYLPSKTSTSPFPEKYIITIMKRYGFDPQFTRFAYPDENHPSEYIYKWVWSISHFTFMAMAGPDPTEYAKQWVKNLRTFARKMDLDRQKQHEFVSSKGPILTIRLYESWKKQDKCFAYPRDFELNISFFNELENLPTLKGPLHWVTNVTLDKETFYECKIDMTGVHPEYDLRGRDLVWK